MSRAARCWNWVAAVGAAVLLAGGTVFLMTQPTRPSCRMVDGGQLRVEAVLVRGQTALVEDGSWGERLLRRAVPDAWKGALGLRIRQPIRVSAGQTLEFRVSRREVGRSWNRVQVGLADAEGRRLHTAEGPETASSLPLDRQDGANWLAQWTFPTAPRRSRTLRLQVLGRQRQGGHLPIFGEVVVRNPLFGRHPVWTAQPLPTLVRDGAVGLRVLDLTAGSYPGSEVESELRLRYRLEEPGQPVGAGRIDVMEVTDATGNRYERHSPWLRNRTPGVAEKMIRGAVAPDEVLHLRVRYGRGPRGVYRPDETWRLRRLAIPRKPGTLDQELQGRVGARTWRVRVGAGFGSGRAPGSRILRIAVTTISAGAPEAVPRLLEPRDEKGRRALVYGGQLRNGTATFIVEVSPDAERLSLACAADQIRVAEFRVLPRQSQILPH